MTLVTSRDIFIIYIYYMLFSEVDILSWRSYVHELREEGTLSSTDPVSSSRNDGSNEY